MKAMPAKKPRNGMKKPREDRKPRKDRKPRADPKKSLFQSIMGKHEKCQVLPHIQVGYCAGSINDQAMLQFEGMTAGCLAKAKAECKSNGSKSRMFGKDRGRKEL
jgi:hypothetical protein